MNTDALAELLELLEARRYDFTTPTPSTSRRMAQKTLIRAPGLRDILGWNRPFDPSAIDADLWALLQRTEALEQGEAGWRSTVRVSRVQGHLFLHSGFPATQADAVFLGPDSYRFADLICATLARGVLARAIVDVGAGAGVGGVVARRYAPNARVIFSDINPQALALAGVNAAHARIDFETVLAGGLENAPDGVELIVANPPYVAGSSGRLYKDGGDLHGGRLSLDWAVAGMRRLAPGGRLILYTGSSILEGGVDALRQALQDAADADGMVLSYRELDPDIFSGELRREAYADVERIAAVGAVITRPA